MIVDFSYPSRIIVVVVFPAKCLHPSNTIAIFWKEKLQGT